ncbi:MAG: hypothetical protein HY287_17385 [Planctomycetes bacterium]|nr:hypothetical protein [Planctomycetota bacterium]MBI3836100.1 hypothetical protein [Planctomycetota bacterium]
MELDLRVRDDPPQHFDSEWVVRSENLGIAITVSINGVYCWDRVIHIDAGPVPASDITHYDLSNGATYQYGCFGICDCIIQPERPMRGSFGLVPLIANPLFRDFALVDIHWAAIATNVYDAVTMDGAGVFRTGGEVAVQQRMILDLNLSNTGPTRFDSGMVIGGGGFPHFDIIVPQENLYGICAGSKLHVVSDPENGQTCGGFAGIPCSNPAEFCKLPVGECCCDFQGVCVPKPQACPTIYDPVCGCDGVTYSSQCEADRAGMSVDHVGPCQPKCAATRDLRGPDLTYCPGHPRGVTIHLAIPNTASAVTLEEILPLGWHPMNISNGGVYDNQYGKIKWGPFFAPFPPQVSYDVMPLDLTNASVCFNGTISIDGSNQPICGDTCIHISCCPAIAADQPQPPCGNCPSASCNADVFNDGNVTLCELISYACAWMHGCNDDLSGMTRAAYLWRNGECYCWNAMQSNWVPDSCDPTIGGPQCCNAPTANSGAPSGDTGSATASIHLSPGPRRSNLWEAKMQISIEPSAGTLANALEVAIPAGWSVTSMSDGAQFDAAHAKVKWGPFMDNTSRTVTLTATTQVGRTTGKTGRPTPIPSVSGFRGTASFDGANQVVQMQR